MLLLTRTVPVVVVVPTFKGRVIFADTVERKEKKWHHGIASFPGHSQILSCSCGEKLEKVWYYYTSWTRMVHDELGLND